MSRELDGIEQLRKLADKFEAAGNLGAMQRTLRTANDLLRDLNKDRIQRNVTPSGKKMRERKEPQLGNAHISFLYERADGFRAIRNLKNYRNEGDKYTGFDRYRGAIRSFLKRRIIRTISLDKRKITAPRSHQKMFKQLIRAKWLKAKMTKQEASIYFAGVADQVAYVHHFGEKDKPNPHAKPVQYPERELLGITDQDIDKIEDLMLKQITEQLK
ncbi:phage virion morphogenesis protein [Aeromonas veronii]|uniref:phage virion morphogenesis protein n=1 Tax=Aeromonas veronii TaxID=654 RepID=UPI003A4E05EE